MKKILLLLLISAPIFSMQPHRAKQSPQINRVRNTTILSGTGAIINSPALGCASMPPMSVTSLFMPVAIIGVAAYRYMTTPADDKKVDDKIVIDKKTDDKNKNQ